MKRTIAFLLIVFVIAGCKKNKDTACGYCPCVNNATDTFPIGTIDSAAFYQSILGTWYLHQFDTTEASHSCSYQCYCDTQYPCVFISTTTFIMTMPNKQKDTFAYSFSTVSPNTINPGSGRFIIQGNPSLICPIIYGSNYLALSTQDLYGADYAPNYYLTRF